MNDINQMHGNQNNIEHINIGYGFRNQNNSSNNVIHINIDKKYNEDIKNEHNKIDEEE